MSLTLSSNLAANKASLDLSKASDALRNSLNRLSSGKRIVNSYDDPGGMSVAYKLQSRLRRTEAVRHNVQNGISFLQVQDGVLASAGNIVSRLSELRTMAQDVTKNTSDIENYSKEFIELQKQLSQMYQEKFNGVSLFSKTSASAISPPNGPVYNKGTEVDEHGNSLTKFSRTIYTHDSGQAANGNVSIGAINFEDVFNLGALDKRYVNTFYGQFANLSNPAGLNLSNYPVESSPANNADTNSNVGVYGAAKGNTRGFGPNIGLDLTNAPGLVGQNADGTYQITTSFAGEIGNNYHLEVVPVFYVSLAGGSGAVSDRALGETYDFTNTSTNTNVTNLTGGLKTISVNGFEQRYQLLKLGTGEAYRTASPNSGNYEYRLEMEAVVEGSVNAVVDNPSLNNFKQMVESGGVFEVDTSLATNPDEWPIPFSQGFGDYDAVPFDPKLDDGYTFSFSGGFDLDSISSAAEEVSSPEQNAEVFTDEGYLSSILYVSMSQFTAVIERIADARAENGAEQSRLQMVDELLATNVTNLEAAHGRIMDVDVAMESTKFARYNVMVQAAASMVAQANQLSSIALTLLGR